MTERPAAPVDLLVDVGDLRRRVGNQRELRRTVPAIGVALTAARVPDGTPVAVDVMLESLSDGVTVVGELTAPWVGECRRCLDEVDGELRVEVREVFADRPRDDDVYATDGDHIDLWSVTRDALVLALPIVPLCRPDCPGPDPESFPVAVEVEEVVDAPRPADPRWAALDALRLDAPEPDDSVR